MPIEREPAVFGWVSRRAVTTITPVLQHFVTIAKGAVVVRGLTPTKGLKSFIWRRSTFLSDSRSDTA
tara:strand:+ start:1169 stop:1369 length:201 start_codon:yes stop_codon:yes gene_type:complete